MSQLAVYTILTFSIYVLLAFSFSLIYCTAKFFNLAHAAIISLGAYLTFLFVNQLSLSLTFSIIGAISTATCFGLALEFTVYRRMRRKNLRLLSNLIASIGLYLIFQNCISLYFGDDTKVISTGAVMVGHKFFSAYVTTIQIITVLVSLVLCTALHLFLIYSSIGKSIRAVSSNPELCNIFGIESNRVILIAFGIGSALAAVAGILSAMDTNMTPTFGFNLLLYGVVAMIIGGVGRTRGLIGGAFLVAAAQHLGAYYIDTKWMEAVTYVILILFLIWKPLGFSGKQLRKVEI